MQETSVVEKAGSDFQANYFAVVELFVRQQHKEELSEMIRTAREQAAMAGNYPGRIPYGYRNNVGEHGKRVIAVDPETGPIVSALFLGYAHGRTMKELLSQSDLRGFGHATRAPQTVRQVGRLLRNGFYTGVFEWSGSFYRGLYQPLVSQEVFEEVQARLHERWSSRAEASNNTCGVSGLRVRH